MTMGGFFSGIGGFELAATQAGITPIWSNEIDPFCCKVLRHHFDHKIIQDDIKKIKASDLEPVDLICGGFPCQPYSHAGKRGGDTDERHLWPEMLRLIRAKRPAWVLGENVYGLINWNEGLVFNEIQTDLENEGYEVQPIVLPAASKNAPHKRDRIWIVAYSDSNRGRQEHQFSAGRKVSETRHKRGRAISNPNKLYGDLSGFYTSKVSQLKATSLFKNTTSKPSNPGVEILRQKRQNTILSGEYATNPKCKGLQKPKKSQLKQPISDAQRNDSQHATNSENIRFQRCKQADGGKREKPHDQQFDGCSGEWVNAWEQWPTQSPVCSRDDGISDRLDGITFSKWRNESIKAYGNAIVPQVAYEILSVIKQIHDSPDLLTMNPEQIKLRTF
jgi:DNA (cytosine-5)-methyltransferase 1